MLERVVHSSEVHQTAEIVQLMKLKLPKEKLQNDIAKIFQRGHFGNEQKYQGLNMELLLMKGKDRSQEDPIEEKALQIFVRNVNRKRNILNKLSEGSIVTTKNEAKEISQVKFKIQELRELARKLQVNQYS